MATKCFITYSLSGEATKNICNRIAKYCARGFRLIKPVRFDGDFGLLTKQKEIPLYRAEEWQIIDDDGEVQTVTKEYWRQSARNIDTYQVQEAFIATVCPHTLAQAS